MDTSYLAQQVNSSIAQLHGLFDEIGVPNHEREARESEVNSPQLLINVVFVYPRTIADSVHSSSRLCQKH